MLHTVDEKRRLSKVIEDRLSKSAEVRPFPAAVTRLTSACQDPNANGRTFEAIIECDPALSAKILRLANSPLFCPSGAVKSIPHAVSLLGLRKLKSVAMSVAGASMFSGGDGALAQRNKLWNHSIGCAVVARTLADRASGIDKDEAFLAGVFHDVGKLLFYDMIPDEYSEVDTSFAGHQLVEEERFLFGVTHEEIGLQSATSWELPSEICTAIRWHHNPDNADEYPQYAHVINAADGLARVWCIGSVERQDPTCVELVADKFELTDDQLDSIRENSRNAFDETMAASTG